MSALIDNHINHGNALRIDSRTIQWKRVIDMNDRALRQVVVGLGGSANGYPREDGYDIIAASEVMAILCLSTSLPDLKERLWGAHTATRHGTLCRSMPATSVRTGR